jgi:isopenicillin N synthase-like dioxygenase
MPRGVYARKSAQRKTAGKVQAKAKAKAAPVAKRAAAVPPAADLARVVTTPAAALQFTAQDFRKPIDDMGGALLKAYARSIGIMQRDVDALTEDRLRQNCKARVIQAIEDA